MPVIPKDTDVERPGDAWKDFLGSVDKKTTFDILDYFYNQYLTHL